MLLALLLAGCEDTVLPPVVGCVVELHEAVPASAAPGDLVTLYGRPFSHVYDTALYVGGVRTEVLEATSEGCDECDTCQADHGCDGCTDCDACDALCQATCVESLTFAVPLLPAGPADVVLFNKYGGSETLQVEVLPRFGVERAPLAPTP